MPNVSDNSPMQSFAIIILIFSISSSMAQSLLAGMNNPEVLKYVKCYGQFTRERLPDNDPMIANLISGKITATNACMQLLAEANLDISSGEIKKISGQYSVKSMAVLKTFNDLHRNWFTNLNFKTIFYGPSTDIFDNGEMGYYFTRALFNNAFDFQSILEGDRTLEGIRTSSAIRPEEYLIQYWAARRVPEKGNIILPYPIGKGNMPCLDNTALRCSTKWEWNDLPLVSLGLLVGIRERTSFISNEFLHQMGKDIDLFQSFGGGLIGSHPYQILNANYPAIAGNGGLIVNRRWSKMVFADLLCRDLPVIRIRDAIPYIDETSKLPFKSGESCMSCHSSMDPMANVTRNIVINANSRNAGPSSTEFLNSFSLGYNYRDLNWNSETETYDNWPDQITNYHLRPPIGRFYFRNMHGELINKNLDGIVELANTLLEQPDLYACTAKKYLYFLTGIRTIIYDQGQLLQPTFTPIEETHQKFVYQLGQELQQHKDLKKTIKSIIDSPFYTMPNFFREPANE